MNAQHKRHLKLCESDRDARLEALPADPDTSEFVDGGTGYAALLARPDRWLCIPAG